MTGQTDKEKDARTLALIVVKDMLSVATVYVAAAMADTIFALGC